MYSLFIHVNVLIAELKYNVDNLMHTGTLITPVCVFGWSHMGTAVGVITVAKSLFSLWGNFFTHCKISVNCSMLFAFAVWLLSNRKIIHLKFELFWG